MEAGETPETCALRETFEELGISPEQIRLLGRLDFIAHRANFLMQPVLGIVDGRALPPHLSPNPAEVEEYFLVPLSHLLDALRPSQVICAGMVRPQVAAMAADRGLTLHDYFAREELAVANAVPTAEGAVQLAMEHLPITIHGSRVLVIGFGRVGRLTAQRFQALGARVSVAARKYEQLAWAQALGFGGEHLAHLKGWLCGYDLIVNTVPAQVLGQEELEDIKPDCLILDLASKPGGVDLGAAGELGLTVIWALSLPGKVAPVTAGAAIKDTIYNMLREIGM